MKILRARDEFWNRMDKPKIINGNPMGKGNGKVIIPTKINIPENKIATQLEITNNRSG